VIATTRSTIRCGVSEETEARAEKQHDEWRRFLSVMQIPADTIGIVLFLTYLRDEEGLSTRQISARLAHIDLARSMRGDQPFRQSKDVQQFMRGLAKNNPLGPATPTSDPMYRELVDVVIDAAMRPNADQQAAIAALLIQEHVRCGTAGLIRLRWRDVLVRSGSMIITCVPPTSSQEVQRPKPTAVPAIGGPLCPVSAVSRWRENGALPNDHLFPTLNKSGRGLTNRCLAMLRRTGDITASVRYASVSARQVRARAMLTLGFGAALTSQEARRLTVGGIEVMAEGLALTVPGRSHVSLLRRDPGMPSCPVAAWEGWRDVLEQHDMCAPECPAFTKLQKERPGGLPLSQPGINDVIKEAVARAGLTRGNYSFSSLRWGAIRTAFRADEPIHSVAQLSGLKAIDGLARHHRREHIVRRSVAGQLGL